MSVNHDLYYQGVDLGPGRYDDHEYPPDVDPPTRKVSSEYVEIERDGNLYEFVVVFREDDDGIEIESVDVTSDGREVTVGYEIWECAVAQASRKYYGIS